MSQTRCRPATLVRQPGSLVHDTFSSTSALASDVENQRASHAGPALVLDNSRSFSRGDELVGRNLLVLFVQTIGPVDIEIHRIESTQAEMQAGIVARVKTGLAEHGLGLCLTPIMGHDARSDRAAV